LRLGVSPRGFSPVFKAFQMYSKQKINTIRYVMNHEQHFQNIQISPFLDLGFIVPEIGPDSAGVDETASPNRPICASRDDFKFKKPR
jgi:hypothetical protein